MEDSPDLKPVFVIWEDAASVDEWNNDMEDVLETDCPIIYSCGFLLEHSDKRLVLALNLDPADGTSSCVMYIPNGMIKSVVYLDK
tara:strand:+ start:175 stop:429 length:255 start_codon:yes stop_codon:yes gene_type:complete